MSDDGETTRNGTSYEFWEESDTDSEMGPNDSTTDTSETDSTPAGKPVEGGTNYTELEDTLAVYEYVGMGAAGLGFFLTPILTAPVVAYCVLKIRHWKPVTALLLIALVLSTAVFWLIVVLFIFP